MSRTVSRTFYTQDGVALGNSWSGVQTNLAKIRQEAGYPKSKEDGNPTTLAYVVGQDNLTGQTLASDGNGSILKGELDSEPKLLTQVTVNRSKSKEGSRQIAMGGASQVKFQSISPQITQGAVGQSEIDICKSASSGGGGAPNPPEEPPEPDEPPPAPPSGPNQPTPNPEEDESQPPGEGCEPESDCQWYNASESGATEGSGCPPGTTSRGFAQLPDGSYKVLCCGPDRPAGDGCPEDPTTYGFQCVNGTCELVPNGLYASASECEAGCNQDEPGEAMRYTCAGIQCIQDPNGEYATLEACQDGCKDGTQTWDPPEMPGSGPCVPVLGTNGQYTSQSECETANGREPRPNGYRITYRGPVGFGSLGSCNPEYTTRTVTVGRIISLTGRCCLGSLGSKSQGLYGSWIRVNGEVRTNAFLTGACGGGLTECGNLTCGPNFDTIINIEPL